MKWLKSAWNWLDKKKTAIGSVALIVSEVVPDPTVKAALRVIGVIFGATGVVHKAVKRDFGKLF